MSEWPRRWNRRDEPGRHCDEYLTETSECQVSVGETGSTPPGSPGQIIRGGREAERI